MLVEKSSSKFLQRLVLSLSSDKALWDAITNNELVKKLQEPPADSGVY